MRDRRSHRAHPVRRRERWLVGIAALLLAQLALAGDEGTLSGWTTSAVVEAANTVRRNGCPGHPGPQAMLQVEPRLDAVALQLLRGRPLEDALAHADYPAVAATTIRVEIRGHAGGSTSAAIRDALAVRFCAQLASSEYVALGVASAGRDAWLVLAAPFAPPAEAQADSVTARVLELVNTARARGRKCGDRWFDAAPALGRSVVLDRAATLHARDLIVLGRLAHSGSDGARPADRISRQGYAWSRVAENLAAGATTAEQVVTGWLDSPAHCANLMSPGFRETGIAYAVSHEDSGEIYWVQALAAP